MATLKKEQYLEEINDIKNKLNDFLSQIQSGKVTYFKDLSLKLRILYCNKSGTKALLETIQKLYGFNIYVIVVYSIKEKVKRKKLPASLIDGLVFEQLNSVIGWFERGDELIPLFDAINKGDEVLIENRNYSYREIFEAIADKMGGAHVDSSIPDEILIPHSNNLQIGGLTVAHRATFDTARATVVLIDMINEFVKTNKETNFIKFAK